VSTVRRLRAPLTAVALFAVAAVLVLFALDARSWSRTVTRDDLRFRALHSHAGLWRPHTDLPGDPARLVLGAAEPVAYRRAVQLFWFSRVGLDPETNLDLPAIRAQAQQALVDLVARGRTPVERSTAANLLGVLTVTTPAADSETQTQTLVRAAGYFQKAIAANPLNVAAKLNLELVLRLRRPGKSGFNKDARGGFGFGKGRGAEVVGSGF
jgi:hypothetical protein